MGGQERRRSGRACGLGGHVEWEGIWSGRACGVGGHEEREGI